MKHKAFCKEHFGGSVEGLSLMDLMQMLHWSRATSIIFITTETITGQICFFEGEVVHAETGVEKGLPAFYAFVQLDHGLFRIKTLEGKPQQRTITDPFRKLTLDAVQIFDETLRGSSEGGQVTALQLVPKQEIEPTKAKACPVVQAFPERKRALHSLDDLCEKIMNQEPDLLACSVVGLEKGIPLGVYQKMHSITPVSYVNAIMESVSALFDSDHIQQMAVVLTGDSEWQPGSGLDEVFFRIGNLDHYLKAIPSKQAVLVLAMKHTVNQALGWLTLRRAFPMVNQALETSTIEAGFTIAEGKAATTR